MNTALAEIRRLLGESKLDDSILFLGHLLSVTRGESKDPDLERKLARVEKSKPLTFVVHFLAKWLLLEASNYGSKPLDFERFMLLQHLYFQIDDPILDDPEWKDAELTGFFERMLGVQFPSQHFKPLQDIGLALGLFRDAGTPTTPEDYDLLAATERTLGRPIEQFMAMGLLAMTARFARHHTEPVPGTFTFEWLAEAYYAGIEWCIPENWEAFLSRVAIDRDGFRALRLDHPEYRVEDERFIVSEFNPLTRRPLIQVESNHFVAVDPRLYVERISLGIYYDLFEEHGLNSDSEFAKKFGEVMDSFVGRLILSVCPSDAIWSGKEWEQTLPKSMQSKKPKHGDWAYRGLSRTVLFESKALRPTLRLLHYGRQVDVEELRVKRLVKAIEQLATQGKAIRNGEYAEVGLPPSQTICVLVSYGKFYSINLPFFRQRVEKELASLGFLDERFVVLSLKELDTVIRLAELGEPLDELVLALSESCASIGSNERLASKLQGKLIASRLTRDAYFDFERRFLPSESKPVDLFSYGELRKKSRP